MLAAALLFAAAADPTPLSPLPSKRQLAWHRMETYAFVHFGPNTFTGQEWGHGNEDPKIFNPEKLDCRQWARVFKQAGLKGVIITAKHHDGFCLWPSKHSTHTVAQSKWKNGRGDVLRELSNACRAEGLKFGVYLSPWDRNHPSYGTPEYNQIFAKTLEEVLTSYGPIFEVWFDGANGEGPNGKRQVYDWNLFIATVRKHQPEAVIFSDAGPDVRWVGNEAGYASETNWNLLRRDEFQPGTPRYKELGEGHLDGSHWLPAECDVSIRPGWFWRRSEDEKVKSVKDLVEIYYGSVGRGSNLLLNIPPNADGLISDVDAIRLKEWREALDREFASKVALAGPREVRDGRQDTFVKADVDVPLAKPASFDRAVLAEPIARGQRVKSFVLEARSKGEWVELGKGTTIGYKRILRFPSVTADRVRLRVLDARAEALVSEISLFQSHPAK